MSRPAERTLPLEGIAAVVRDVSAAIAEQHPALARMFAQCFPCTVETTTELLDDGTTFVFTGDIPAMWLRDSAAQVRPYLPLLANDPALAPLISGLIRRQAMYLLIDPYANAFNREPNGQGHTGDRPTPGPWVWERKFELDSLCYPVQLLHDYWQATGDHTVCGETTHQMLRRIVEVMTTEQHHRQRSTYWFERDVPPDRPLDTLANHGLGTPSNFTGMIWSGFRPSDDACTFHYLIPANMFAVVVLGQIAHMAHACFDDIELAATAETLRQQVERGIETYGVVDHPRFGRIYAYETDGFGNHLLMDDANVPSLLAIPYLGYRAANDPTYQRTRRFVLSTENPYYVEGRYARGIGSPHTPPGYLWPIALCMQGLTSIDAAEQVELLDMLAATTAGTDVMHESFDPDNPAAFTRPWFAWANSLFAEFVLRWMSKHRETIA